MKQERKSNPHKSNTYRDDDQNTANRFFPLQQGSSKNDRSCHQKDYYDSELVRIRFCRTGLEVDT